MSLPPRLALLLLLACLPGCRNPEAAALQQKQAAYARHLQEAENGLAAERFDGAVQAAQAAISVDPSKGEPHRLLARAEAGRGNDTAAILAYREAKARLPHEGALLDQELLALYRTFGHAAEALELGRALRAEGQLDEAALLQLVRDEAAGGSLEAARASLVAVRAAFPESLEAQVVDAELLLQAGDEVEAGRRMDKLVSAHDLPSARLLRARYFLQSGYPEFTRRDVALLPDSHRRLPQAVDLEARALRALQKEDEAEKLLQSHLAESPDSPELLALLAEVKLLSGHTQDASGLVDQALTLRPRFARALYVRGRAQEMQGEWHRALESYADALQAEPGFPPALSRVWRVHLARERPGEAMLALEALLQSGQATLEDKVALAVLYAKGKVNTERALKLVGQALRQQPKNAEYKALEAELRRQARKTGKKRRPGIVILRGGK